jgi:mannose-6-phosphate isomerase-like protein (cupin superfamily)
MEIQHAPTRATDDFVVVAPDGIAVHPILLPGLVGLTLAEGRLPPGEFGVHAHRSLEQITYVLSGHVVVIMGDPDTGAMTELNCGPGDTIATPPLVSLSYRNPGPDPVRVLFLCAPPYPADDADTMTLDRHRPLTDDERAAALDRIRAVRALIDAQFAAAEARLTPALP